MTLQRPQQSGFSLVEILAVVFVIVLLTSMVTFNVGTGGQDIEVETQMLDLVDTARYALMKRSSRASITDCW